MVAQPVQPVYVWVPQGHRKHWSKHCHDYNACGVPVYFVRHDWYHDHVMVAQCITARATATAKARQRHGKGKGHD